MGMEILFHLNQGTFLLLQEVFAETDPHLGALLRLGILTFHGVVPFEGNPVLKSNQVFLAPKENGFPNKSY